jgi:hypothetical protein
MAFASATLSADWVAPITFATQSAVRHIQSISARIAPTAVSLPVDLASAAQRSPSLPRLHQRRLGTCLGRPAQFRRRRGPKPPRPSSVTANRPPDRPATSCQKWSLCTPLLARKPALNQPLSAPASPHPGYPGTDPTKILSNFFLHLGFYRALCPMAQADASRSGSGPFLPASSTPPALLARLR